MAFDLCLGNQGQKTKDLVGGLITARNEVGARLCFTRVCDSVHGGGGGGIPACIASGIPACLAAGLQGEGWYPSMPSRFPGPSLGGKLRGLAGGRSPGPHQGSVSQHALRQTPPPPDGYCCSRYASYWNAFLFIGNSHLHFSRMHVQESLRCMHKSRVCMDEITCQLPSANEVWG